MSQGRALRIREVAAYLNVSHQRVTQMYAEGKLPEPERVDAIGLEADDDRAMGEAGVVGDAALEGTALSPNLAAGNQHRAGSR